MPNAVLSSPPPDDELVIGLVAAVGIDLGELVTELRAVLSEFGYQSRDLHLTDAFGDLPWEEALVKAPYDERIWSYMDAGDALRQKWARRDAMALIAALQIAVTREELTGDQERPAARTAYVLRSLKRPEEIALLRSIYGRRFFVIGVATEEDARLEYLKKKIRRSRIAPYSREPVHPAEELAGRDEKDEANGNGQNVRDTFHRADVFVDLSTDPYDQLVRAFDVLHGSPRCSPSRDEVGMMHAATAALRSAELGRQVGAAICTRDGAVVATGTNEVPKAFGGQYWEGDPADARDIHTGQNTNAIRRRQLGLEIADVLSGVLESGVEPQRIVSMIEAGRFGDIIEYVRAVHAEMAALTDAALRGTSVAGCTLYTTTFPCHHCARHILAAGIARVVFVAPYAKSLAVSLHGDAMGVGTQPGGVSRVPFQPFVGIGPRRYGALFFHEDREDERGKLREYDRMTAPARIEDRDPAYLRSDNIPYLQRERRSGVLLAEAEEQGSFKMSRR
jgi:cytidine deaminase